MATDYKKLAETLQDALQKASEHLDYCGYGDSWERECAEAQKLEDQITAALTEAEAVLGKPIQ